MTTVNGAFARLEATTTTTDSGSTEEDDSAVPQAGSKRCSGFSRCKTWLCGHPDALGFGFNFVSVALFSITSLLIKLAGSFMGSFELVFCRSVVQLIAGVAWMLATTHAKVNPFGPFADRTVMVLLFARATIGIASMSCWFWSLRLLPLSESTLINFLSPVWTAAFGFCILKERITRLEILGMGFSFIGILLVARPPFIFRWLGYYEAGSLVSETSSSSLSGGLNAEMSRTIGAGIGITGTMFAGMAYVLTRKIGKRVHSSVIVNWLSLAGIVYMPLPAYLVEKVVVPRGIQWACVIGIGVVAFGAQSLHRSFSLIRERRMCYSHLSTHRLVVSLFVLPPSFLIAQHSSLWHCKRGWLRV